MSYTQLAFEFSPAFTAPPPAFSADGQVFVECDPNYLDPIRGYIGAGYVYRRSGASWTLSETIIDADISNDGKLGAAGWGVSGDAQYAAFVDVTGYCRIYKYNGSTWDRQAVLYVMEPYSVSFSGRVSITNTGTKIMVGAPGFKLSPGGPPLGAVFVTTRSGTTWSAFVGGADGAPNSNNGAQVVISDDGNTIVYSAPSYLSGAGWVRIATFNGDIWTTTKTYIGSSGQNLGASLGFAQSTADYIIASAVGSEVAYVYAKVSGTWGASAQSTLTNNDSVNTNRFGNAVSMSEDGTTVVVASESKTVPYPGVYSVRTRSGTTWTEDSTYTPIGTDNASAYTSRILLSRDATLFVTAPGSSATTYFADEASTSIDFSIDATTADATCAAVFLVPSELTISATTADATCAAVFLVPSELTISAPTADATCTAVFSVDITLSIAASTAAATCAAVFLVPSDLTISAITTDATCVASFFVGAKVFSVDITTADATCVAVFSVPPNLTISATTADATCVASFRAGNGLTISATTADATCAAVFDAPPNLTISATTADATCVASFRAGNGLTISATTADATCAASFSVTAGIVINARTEDATCVAHFYFTPQLTIIAKLEDAVATSGATATYVYHPDHDAFTEYLGFAFNSYARIGGNYFAAGNNGLYQLGGDDDAGVDIQAYILTGMLDFGGHMMSRTPRMYFDFSGDSGLAVSVYTSTDGLRRTEAFTLSLPAAPVDRSACLPLGRGLPSHFWQYRVSNVTGGSLEFTRCAPHVIPLSRSV